MPKVKTKNVSNRKTVALKKAVSTGTVSNVRDAKAFLTKMFGSALRTSTMLRVIRTTKKVSAKKKVPSKYVIITANFVQETTNNKKEAVKIAKSLTQFNYDPEEVNIYQKLL